MTAFRLAHISDVHLTARPLGWHPRDLLTKRTTGWVNVRLLGRGRSFRLAPRVVAALRRELLSRPIQGLVFTGDATGLGYEAEFAAASHALGVDDTALPPAVAVPGNHDYYTHRAVERGYFELYFEPWLQGSRIDNHTYPYARKLGPVWCLGVNSSTPNRWTWDASGAVDDNQLLRLRQLCDTLGPGPRVLVTHYPLRTARGEIEPRVHRLRNHEDVLAAAIDCQIGLWLHGHIHRAFHRAMTSLIPFPIVCVGSSTQRNRWGYNEYEFDDGKVSVIRREYLMAQDHFHDVDRFELEMPMASSWADTSALHAVRVDKDSHSQGGSDDN